MPLLDDLGFPQQTFAPREEAQRRREQNPFGGAGGTDLIDEITKRTERQRQSKLPSFADLTKVLDKSAPDLASLLGGVGQTAARTAATGVAAGAGATALAAGGQASPLIGTKNYRTGRGDPAIRAQAQKVASFMGWNQAQFDAWDALINAESGWRPTAQNPTSTAYGLGQFLNSTWGSYGPKTSDPYLQLQYMARYIKNRYGDPLKALAFHGSRSWY